MLLNRSQTPFFCVGRRSHAFCTASLSRGGSSRSFNSNYGGTGSRDAGSASPYGRRSRDIRGSDAGSSSNDRDARSHGNPSSHGLSNRDNIGNFRGRGRGQGRGHGSGGRSNSVEQQLAPAGSESSTQGRGQAQGFRGRGRGESGRGRGRGQQGRGGRFGRPNRNDLDDGSDDDEDDEYRGDTGSTRKRGAGSASTDGDFIVIGRADTPSAVRQKAAVKGAADGAADSPSSSSGIRSTTDPDLLDGSRFWKEVSGIDDADYEDGEEEEEEEGEEEGLEGAEGEEDEDEDVPQSPEQLLARMQQLGFTLQQQQQPDTGAGSGGRAPAAAAADTGDVAAAAKEEDENAAASSLTKAEVEAPAPHRPEAAAAQPPRGGNKGAAGVTEAVGAAAGADLALRDLRDTFIATMTPPSLPPWFLGPLEVVAAGRATGRGVSLRATRSVAAGELLAVSLPLAIRYSRRGTTPENEELADLMMLTMTGQQQQQQGQGRHVRHGGVGGNRREAAAAAAAGSSSGAVNGNGSFSGLTDLQQSLLGLLPRAAPAAAAAPGGSSSAGGASSSVAVGPAVKRAFLEMVARSAADSSAPRSPPVLGAEELYRVVNGSCMGEEFQDLVLCKLRGERPMGHIALWPEAAFTSHSCAPTATAYALGDRLITRAAVDILKGGEVSLNWLGSLLTSPLEVRRAELRQKYGFTCGCVRCTAEAKYDSTPLAALLMSVYDTCQQLSPRLEQAIAAGDVAAVGAAREQLRGLQEQVEAAIRTASPKVNSKVRRWLQASVYDLYDLVSLSADELAAAAAAAGGAREQSFKASPPAAAAAAAALVETESLAQCCRIIEGVTPGSDAHVSLSAELVMRCLERFGPQHEEYLQVRAGVVRAYGARYGNVSPAVMEQLVAARLAAEAEDDEEAEEEEEEEEDEEGV
ncbi:hypothetical protein Agub_g6222 [Astrephomene gubernaculifera]|uniref:SET domain-containing protein n=1 Tax=Astrephomene gubernaculifera TaxID=47775 RepID=A0AAD3DN05_9CHLO|nr:hypothetical protein Agub_g6222 [Astrephomene gubernaculifera]